MNQSNRRCTRRDVRQPNVQQRTDLYDIIGKRSGSTQRVKKQTKQNSKACSERSNTHFTNNLTRPHNVTKTVALKGSQKDNYPLTVTSFSHLSCGFLHR